MAGIGQDLEKLRSRKRKAKQSKPRKNADQEQENNTQPDNTTQQPDKEPNKRKIRFTQEDRRVDQELTHALFSEIKDKEDFTNKRQRKNKQKKSQPQHTTKKQGEEVEEIKAAWSDEDDSVLVNTKRTLHLDDKIVSGHAYQQKLRAKHKMLSAQSDEWAQVIKPKKKKEGDEDSSDDDDDAFLYRSQPLTVPGTRLTPGIIKVSSKIQLQQHQSPVRRVIIHPTQPSAISIDGNTVNVYRLGEKAEIQHSVRMKDMDILDACFTADGSQIFMCGNQASMYVLEVGSGKITYLRNILGRKDKQYTKIYPAPNGKECALLAGGGTIVIVSTNTKAMITELKGPSNMVYSATYAPDGRLFSSYDGGVIVVWDVEQRVPVHSFTNPSLQFATALSISPDNKYFAVGSNSGVVDVFIMADMMGSRSSMPHVSITNLLTSITCIKFNHDSQIMAITTDVTKRGLRLIHIPSFEVYKNWPNATDTFSLIKDVSFSPHGGFIMLGENTGRVKMYRFPHYPAA